MTEKLKVYGDSRSGNCYKIQMLCAELAIPYTWQEVDILAGESRTPQFLAMNPNGRVPLLALPDGTYLAESNAILCYLANGHALAGSDRFGRAQVLQWLFFEQYSHEPYIATSRFIIRYLGSPPERQADLEGKKKGGYAALGVLEKQLLNNAYMAGDNFSIADIALFAYTHVADEGGFDLKNYPAIRAWIRTIERRPKFVAMKAA
jgi:glutathione S-transferase